MHKKVVVTGVGALAPNGNSAEQFWSAIESGTSGIAPITYFDASNHRVSIAGELKNFNPEDTLDPKEIRKLDPFSTFALVCSNEAVRSAILGIIFATNCGDTLLAPLFLMISCSDSNV